ncbi:hypothetical protein Btru_068762 [Bulinus truncatus]|nr:hypothetical protein Btru_068762 [Bulinus truncatus]
MNETTMSPPTAQAPPMQSADYNPRFWNGMIVLAFLLGNIVGNGLVFCVYFYSVKRNVFSFYVIVLATLDLATAFTTMLFDVVIKMTDLDPDSPVVVALCKFSHFQVYTNHMLCGFILILIAHQRYTKVSWSARVSWLKVSELVIQGELIVEQGQTEGRVRTCRTVKLSNHLGGDYNCMCSI